MQAAVSGKYFLEKGLTKFNSTGHIGDGFTYLYM